MCGQEAELAAVKPIINIWNSDFITVNIPQFVVISIKMVDNESAYLHRFVQKLYVTTHFWFNQTIKVKAGF